VKLSIVALQSIRDNPSAAQFARDGLRQALSDNMLRFEQRRMLIDDIQSVADLNDREVFMCGPDALMNWSEMTLTELDVNESRRHRESFIF
jgi:ferredoxin-NADP reductase